MVAIYSRGTLLQGRYRVIEAVGTGGYGVVYKAEDTSYNDYLVAVKSINLAGLSTQEVIEATEAFNREVTLLSNLRHYSLPIIHDHFTDPEHWYMVMDFIEGKTLEDYIAHSDPDLPQNGTRCLPLPEVLDIGMQLCTALGYLHMQEPPVIFRDLKPANIMRMADGHLYLIDFGIARRFTQGQAKDTIPLGSPGYAAPEQYGRTQTTTRSDIYSLGAVLHQFLTGDDPAESPFQFAPLLTEDRPVLKALNELLLQMVEKDERNRPGSITIVKRRLQQIQLQLSSPRVVDQPVKTRKIRVSRRVFVGTLAAALAAGVLVKTIPTSFIHENIYVSDEMSPPVRPQPGMQEREVSKAIYTYQSKGGAVMAVAWSPTGYPVAIGDQSGNVSLWGLDASAGGISPQQLSTTSYSFPYPSPAIQSLSWSPDGQQLAIVKGDYTVYVWDIKKSSVVCTYENAVDISGTVWSPNGAYIAASNGNSDIVLYEAGTTQQVAQLNPRTSSSESFLIIWSPDSRVIATIDASALLTFWESATGRQLYGYSDEIDGISNASAAAWSPDGRSIVLGGADRVELAGRLTLLSTKSYPYNAVLNYVTADTIEAISWSPDSTHIALGCTNPTIQILNAATFQTEVTYTGHRDNVNSISWSPDGSMLASGSDDGTVQVWQPFQS